MAAGLVGASLSARAQFSNYISLGYNQSFSELENLDYVVGRYNATRPYLETQMGNLSYPGGFTLEYGWMTGNLLIEAGYTAQKRKRFAQGVDQTGTTVRRDLRFRNNAFDLGLGYRVAKGDWGSIIPGVKGAIGTLSISTRVGQEDQVGEEKYEKPIQAFHPGVQGFVQVMIGSAHSSNMKVMLTPYYQLSLKEVDMAPLNFAINPATADADPSTLPVKGDAFGLKLQIAFFASGH